MSSLDSNLHRTLNLLFSHTDVMNSFERLTIFNLSASDTLFTSVIPAELTTTPAKKSSACSTPATPTGVKYSS